MRKIIVFLVLLLAACGSAALVDTPLKRWAVAQESLSAVTLTIVRLIDDGHVSLEDAELFVQARVVAQASLDAAKTYIDNGNAEKAADALARAEAVISELTTVVEGAAAARRTEPARWLAPFSHPQKEWA